MSTLTTSNITGNPTSSLGQITSNSNTATFGTSVYFVANGNVGLGTSSPGYSIDVFGQGQIITGSSLNNGRYLGRNTSGTLVMDFGIGTGTGSGNNIGLYNLSSTGVIVFGTNNIERIRITDTGAFQFNSGYGSVATAFGCRAWINFDGSTATPTIRGSGNITSITDNGVGDYTLNFTTAMPDINYAVMGVTNEFVLGNRSSGWCIRGTDASLTTTSSVRIDVGSQSSGSAGDSSIVTVAVFR
jgi:hypothetical protein